MHINVKRCAVQTLTAINEDADNVPSTRITDIDSDSCHDIAVSSGEMIEAKIEFGESFTIPCTDYSAGETGRGNWDKSSFSSARLTASHLTTTPAISSARTPAVPIAVGATPSRS